LPCTGAEGYNSAPMTNSTFKYFFSLLGRARAAERVHPLGREIPVIISIDAEPDEWLLQPGRRDPWHGYEISQRFFEELRPALGLATRRPVHYTWFYRILVNGCKDGVECSEEQHAQNRRTEFKVKKGTK